MSVLKKINFMHLGSACAFAGAAYMAKQQLDAADAYETAGFVLFEVAGVKVDLKIWLPLLIALPLLLLGQVLATVRNAMPLASTTAIQESTPKKAASVTKSATKKPAAKKSATKKSPAARKSRSKTPVKKASAKKVAKKSSAKKVAPKKSPVVKKSRAKTPVKKSSAKKTAPKKSPVAKKSAAKKKSASRSKTPPKASVRSSRRNRKAPAQYDPDQGNKATFF